MDKEFNGKWVIDKEQGLIFFSESSEAMNALIDILKSKEGFAHYRKNGKDE